MNESRIYQNIWYFLSMGTSPRNKKPFKELCVFHLQETGSNINSGLTDVPPEVQGTFGEGSAMLSIYDWLIACTVLF